MNRQSEESQKGKAEGEIKVFTVGLLKLFKWLMFLSRSPKAM